jgi:hypothetical protein
MADTANFRIFFFSTCPSTAFPPVAATIPGTVVTIGLVVVPAHLSSNRNSDGGSDDDDDDDDDESSPPAVLVFVFALSVPVLLRKGDTGTVDKTTKSQ